MWNVYALYIVITLPLHTMNCIFEGLSLFVAICAWPLGMLSARYSIQMRQYLSSEIATYTALDVYMANSWSRNQVHVCFNPASSIYLWTNSLHNNVLPLFNSSLYWSVGIVNRSHMISPATACIQFLETHDHLPRPFHIIVFVGMCA